MNSVNSFKGYGKVDELEEAAFKRKSRKRAIILSVSLLLLIVLIIGIVAGTLVHRNSNNDSGDVSAAQAAAINSICGVTQHMESCVASLKSSNSTNPAKIFEFSLMVVMNSLKKIADFPNEYASKTENKLVKEALTVCSTVLDDAVESLNDTIVAVQGGEKLASSIDDLRTWLSATVTDQETCIDALEEANATFAGEIKLLMKNSTEFASNSLAIVTKIVALIGDFKIPFHRRLLAAADSEFPGWVTAGDRRLLQETQPTPNVTQETQPTPNVTVADRRLLQEAQPTLNVTVADWLLNLTVADRGLNLTVAADSEFPGWVTVGNRRLLQEAQPTPNVTVAADGSGNVKSVAEAVAMIPKKSAERFVIYVKAGEYVENIDMDKSYWNVMIYGDGKGATVISGSKNFVDGTPTFSTATFAIAGRGFIARDITFKNTAGPEKHQAVAFRSGSDESVYYRCSFDAFQDTLYTHSNRQFYRDCDVTGTIDFIFGNAGVVFQNCNIQPRQPMSNQFVTITAQGKKDPNQNTGISIQRCTISPSDNLTAQTYLGRPWKDYSVTVIMESSIGGFLNPKGWISWVQNVDPPTTIFYGEYRNTGPGSDTANRVVWAGYKPTMTPEEASKYSVEALIQGPSWLPSTNVTFDST